LAGLTKLAGDFALLRQAARRTPDGAFQRLELARRILAPDFVLGAPGRTWFRDGGFWDGLDRFEPYGLRPSAERYYNLAGVARLALDVRGEFAECGCFFGGSTYVISRAIVGHARTLHVFDSFLGLPEPSTFDARLWKAGEFRADRCAFERLTEEFDGIRRVHAGVIPQVLEAVSDMMFAFVHLDVDLYEPTRDSLRFFYPRTMLGGVIICDDYGFVGETGARRAFDELARETEETVVALASGQAFIVKGRVGQSAPGG
jgi:O-methyltransferase